MSSENRQGSRRQNFRRKTGDRRQEPRAEGGESYRWVETEAGLAEVVEAISAEPRFALDTEFHRERTYYPKVALVQIAWDKAQHVVLIDPLKVDIAPLASALSGPGMVVMHAAQQDLEVLQRACDTVPAVLFDTQIAAGFVGLSSPSLSTLSDRFLRQRLPKGDRLTDWFQRPLNQAQREYAASDVLYLEEIHDLLVADLTERGRVEWARDECEKLRVKPLGDSDPTTAWQKIKEARHLRGQARCIARELGAWRETTAQNTDQPVRFVLSDLALVAVSQKAPATIDQLRSVRGLDGRHLKDGAGTLILEAVQRGADLPEDAIESARTTTPTLERRLRPAVTLVSAWISQLARDSDLDPALLATRSDIIDFLRDEPDASLREGWRQDIVGSRITSLVDGRAALAFDDGALVLVER
ncbi:MAG: hypothetical protein GY708_04615 [Actinomycetia bacterium]|nr:hypothetical protein [Actinomycetes bacterium]MCP4963029.1 hypothetical protein [Actinomycetes bacterium]